MMSATHSHPLSTSTHDSRHDDRRSSIADIPPPYAEEAGIPLPEYSFQAPEPLTLAKLLFKFGFVFPPFWLFGIGILFSDLTIPDSHNDCSCSSPCPSPALPAWMPEKTEAERQQILTTLRDAEVKWARRCLLASIVFTIVVVTAAVTAWFIHHTFSSP